RPRPEQALSSSPFAVRTGLITAPTVQCRANAIGSCIRRLARKGLIRADGLLLARCQGLCCLSSSWPGGFSVDPVNDHLLNAITPDLALIRAPHLRFF